MFEYQHISDYIKKVTAPLVNNLRLLIRDNTNLTERMSQELNDRINKLKKEHSSDDTEIRELIKKLRLDLDDKLESVREEITIIKESPQVPIGTVLIWPHVNTPEPATTGRWLECNGQSFKQSVYPELYAILGTNIVPNFQGLFLRGYGSQNHIKNNGSRVGNTNTTHASDRLGVIQGDTMREIYGKMASYGLTGWHNYLIDTSGFVGITGRAYCTGSQARNDMSGEFDFYSSRVAPTSNEVRPANMAVRYYIVAN